MIPLPRTFTANGFEFTLLRREGMVCLLSKRWVHSPDPEPRSWEVVRLQRHAAHTFPTGKTYEAREAMPPSEDWGVRGWTYPTREAAMVRFMDLCGS